MKITKYIPTKNWLLSTIATILLLLVTTVSIAHAQDIPAAPRALVSDFTNTLSGAQKNALEQKLLAFNDTTSTQIAVVLVQTTDGYDIADYAVRLAQKWGVGNAKYNNGIVLLAAIGDRAVTIQTGYGVEGALPDAIAYRIIENDIKPAFRQSDYFGGLDAATNSIISYTKGEYKADAKANTKYEGKSPFSGVIVIIVVIIIIGIISKKGGGGNNGGRVINGKGSSDLFWWMLLNGMGNSRGGGGGFGGGFGGGDSGGGFGGFGGGGFGGGGASGRW